MPVGGVFEGSTAAAPVHTKSPRGDNTPPAANAAPAKAGVTHDASSFAYFSRNLASAAFPPSHAPAVTIMPARGGAVERAAWSVVAKPLGDRLGQTIIDARAVGDAVKSHEMGTKPDEDRREHTARPKLPAPPITKTRDTAPDIGSFRVCSRQEKLFDAMWASLQIRAGKLAF